MLNLVSDYKNCVLPTMSFFPIWENSFIMTTVTFFFIFLNIEHFQSLKKFLSNNDYNDNHN